MRRKMANGKITLRDLMNSQNRVEDKIDSFRKEINKKFDDMEDRIGRVERWKENISGKVTMVIGIISIAFNVVWELIKGKFSGK